MLSLRTQLRRRLMSTVLAALMVGIAGFSTSPTVAAKSTYVSAVMRTVHLTDLQAKNLREAFSQNRNLTAAQAERILNAAPGEIRLVGYASAGDAFGRAQLWGYSSGHYRHQLNWSGLGGYPVAGHVVVKTDSWATTSDGWFVGGAGQETFTGDLWHLGGSQTIADGWDVLSENYYQNWSLHAVW